MKVTGRHGLDLHEHWKGDARAYLDITIPGLRHARERRDLQAAVDTYPLWQDAPRRSTILGACAGLAV